MGYRYRGYAGRWRTIAHHSTLDGIRQEGTVWHTCKLYADLRYVLSRKVTILHNLNLFDRGQAPANQLKPEDGLFRKKAWPLGVIRSSFATKLY